MTRKEIERRILEVCYRARYYGSAREGLSVFRAFLEPVPFWGDGPDEGILVRLGGEA